MWNGPLHCLLTGLILFIPANLLPLVGIKILGNNKDGTLWTGVEALYTGRYVGVGDFGVSRKHIISALKNPFVLID